MTFALAALALPGRYTLRRPRVGRRVRASADRAAARHRPRYVPGTEGVASEASLRPSPRLFWERDRRAAAG